MNIKHSKYKNTGILFELLVRQITSDTLSGKDSKATNILKKYFVKTDERTTTLVVVDGQCKATDILSKKEKPKINTVFALSTQNIEFINNNIKSNLTPKQITELLFHEKYVGLENINIFLTN